MVFLLVLPILGQCTACKDLPPHQMFCNETTDCNLNSWTEATCFATAACEGDTTFNTYLPCIYCWQLASDYYTCDETDDCTPSLGATPLTCTAQTHCLGNPVFLRNGICRRASKSQIVAAILSLFLGLLGIDRFYLGYIGVGIVKLLTFGGLGVIYLCDFLLILVGYLGPEGSVLYTERV